MSSSVIRPDRAFAIIGGAAWTLYVMLWLVSPWPHLREGLAPVILVAVLCSQWWPVKGA